ncbi:unnamed protein product [Schistosoma turkestanicum]|nr:unnamed protein product [Schistosoma turkestanicum]
MDSSKLPEKNTNLSELLDLALGTPDPGSVNFGILYIILSHIIKHLELSDVEPCEEKNLSELYAQSEAKFPGSGTDQNIYHGIQKRLLNVESQLELLNSLPNNLEIIGLLNNNKTDPTTTTNTTANDHDNQNDTDENKIKSKKIEHSLDPTTATTDEHRIVSQLWQSVQTNKRLDATEEGLHRLSSLTDDLLEQIKKFAEQNKALKAELEEALENSSLKEKLAQLTEKLGEIERNQNEDADRLQNAVHRDALRSSVYWQALGKSITGVECSTPCMMMDDNKSQRSNSIIQEGSVGGSNADKTASGARASTVSAVSVASVTSTGGRRDESSSGLMKSLPEEYTECPDPQLSSTLRKLGNVASSFDSVVSRIEQLEIAVQQQDTFSDKMSIRQQDEMSDKMSLRQQDEMSDKMSFQQDEISDKVSLERQGTISDKVSSIRQQDTSTDKVALQRQGTISDKVSSIRQQDTSTDKVSSIRQQDTSTDKMSSLQRQSTTSDKMSARQQDTTTDKMSARQQDTTADKTSVRRQATMSDKDLIEQKADRSDLISIMGTSAELSEKVSNLEASVKELSKEREKIYVDGTTSPHMPYPSDNKKLIKKLQDTMSVLQEQINQQHDTVTDVKTQFKKLHETVVDVKQFANDLESRKADATYIDEQLDKKYDREEAKSFINRTEFESTNRVLEKLAEDLFTKLATAETELKSSLNDLQGLMEGKLDRDEMEQFREWLQKRFKSINKQLNPYTQETAGVGQTADDAAGLKRAYTQHYHCISCDRPLDVALNQDRSNKTFYIDPPFKRTSNNYYDVYGGTPRPCGGQYTAVSSSTTSKKKPHVTQCKRETLSIQGMDGHIYRGSPVHEIQQSTNNNTDLMSTMKDDENFDKDNERNKKLPPVSIINRSVKTVTTTSKQPQVAYKYIGTERREKSQSPQRIKRVNSDELQFRRSIQLLPPASHQRIRKIQPVQPNTSKLLNEHVVVRTNGYAVIYVPNSETIEQETVELKTENGWVNEKANNECSSPVYEEKHSSTYPSPVSNHNDDDDDGGDGDDDGEMEIDLVTIKQSSPDVNSTVEDISN